MIRTSSSGFMKIVSTVVIVLAGMLAVTCDDSSKKDQNKQLLPLLLLGAPCTLSTTSTKLILYNADTHDGNLGGRKGADKICNDSVNKPTGVTKVHAFISISTTDDILHMPTNYCYQTNQAIYGPDGTSLIANSWADLTDQTIAMTLYSAGILPDPTGWWSGSNNDSSWQSGHSCNNFTSASSSYIGAGGSSSWANWRWIYAGDQNCDSVNPYVMCIGEK